MTPEIEIIRLIRKALPQLEIKKTCIRDHDQTYIAINRKAKKSYRFWLSLPPGKMNGQQKTMVADEAVLLIKRALK